MKFTTTRDTVNESEVGDLVERGFLVSVGSKTKVDNDG